MGVLTQKQLNKVADSRTKKTIKSWSTSRNPLEKGCARQYFYSYVATQADPRPEWVSKLWGLKKLQTPYLTIGTIVHEVAQEVLESAMRGEEYTYAEALKAAQQKFEALKSTKFMASVYDMGNTISDHEDRRALPHLFELLRRLWDNPVFKKLRDIPDQIVEVDLSFNKFTMPVDGNEVEVYAIPDVVVKRGGKYKIVDWKTGSLNNTTAEQSKTYALYVSQKYNVPLIEVECWVVGLKEDDVKVYTFTDREEIEKEIKDSIRTLRNLFMTGDPERNADSLQTIDVEEAYPMTSDESKCFWCGYREFCGR